MRKTHKPNLFVVGYPKSGTTVLYEYLKKHPQITLPSKKEPRYFAKDFIEESKKYKSIKKFCNYTNIKDYLSLFKSNNVYLADFSPHYIISSQAAKLIYEFNSESKIIIVLREPTSFLFSFHAQCIERGYETEFNFNKALHLECNRKKGINIPKNTPVPSLLFYSELVQYSNHLLRYLEYFPTSQIKIFFFEDLKKDNQKIVNQICDFLKIRRITIKQDVVNPRTKPRFGNFRYFFVNFYSKNMLPIFKYIFPQTIRSKLGDMFDKLTLTEDKNSKIDPKLELKLKKQFKPEVVKLNKLLHKENLVEKDFDLIKYWGYDTIK